MGQSILKISRLIQVPRKAILNWKMNNFSLILILDFCITSRVGKISVKVLFFQNLNVKLLYRIELPEFKSVIIFPENVIGKKL